MTLFQHFCVVIMILSDIINTKTTVTGIEIIDTHIKTRNTTYGTFIWQSNDTYWHSLTPFIPISGESYGTIKLGRSVQCEYKFIYHGSSQFTTHENVFRVGYSDTISNKHDGAGSRYPSMWIYYKNTQPQVQFAISNQDNTWNRFPLYRIYKEQMYSVSIILNQTYIFICISTVNSDPYIIVNEQRSAPTFDNFLNTDMHIWISQFGHHGVPTIAANVTLFNITICMSDQTTLEPTTEITTANTKSPTKAKWKWTTSDKIAKLDSMQVMDHKKKRMDNVTLILLLGSIIIIMSFCGFMIFWCIKFNFCTKNKKNSYNDVKKMDETDSGDEDIGKCYVSKGTNTFNTMEVRIKHNGINEQSKIQKDNKIFGGDCNKDYKSKIPNVLIKLRKELFKNNGHLIEGIFQISPNDKQFKYVISQINNGK
eukprot:217163_1